MQTQARVFKPETKPADCYDWITAEDVIRHALASFYVACKMAEPEDGEPFVGSGGSRAFSRGDFFDNLADHFKHRLARHAQTVGMQGFDGLAQFASNIEQHYPPMQPRVHRA